MFAKFGFINYCSGDECLCLHKHRECEREREWEEEGNRTIIVTYAFPSPESVRTRGKNIQLFSVRGNYTNPEEGEGDDEGGEPLLS